MSLTQFVNCRILRNSRIIKEDLWVRNGLFENPERIFFDEQIKADNIINCKNAIIAPGFIDLQINGGFGIDFSFNIEDVEKGVEKVAKGILSHGVTSFCPTLVTSPKDVYHRVLPLIKRRKGGKNGATVLGVHVEGPFINIEKKGAHHPECIRKFTEGMNSVEEIYGNLDNVEILTLAPELENALSVVKELTDRHIVVSMGHSTADIGEGEKAVQNGATLITHLFNAMLPFHHRDPGLVGLLASDNIPKNRTVYFGIIADGIHTHPAALRIAYRAHPEGVVLTTDAISAIGLSEGVHNIGQMKIEVRNGSAYVAGTDTLCGSIADMHRCVQIFKKATGCTTEYVLEAASLHPAQVLNISEKKGTLNYHADADFIMLDDDLEIISTWIAGEKVYPQN